jgi:hypothetical protein
MQKRVEGCNMKEHMLKATLPPYFGFSYVVKDEIYVLANWDSQKEHSGMLIKVLLTQG